MSEPTGYSPDYYKSESEMRKELAEAAKVVRKCHDERNAAVSELATTKALMKELAKGRLEAAADTAARHMAELAAKDARIAELEDHAILATLAKNNEALRKELVAKDARIAELGAQNKNIFVLNCQLKNELSSTEKLPHHGVLKQKAWLEGECERLEAARREMESLALRAAVENQTAINDLRARAERAEARVAELEANPPRESFFWPAERVRSELCLAVARAERAEARVAELEELEADALQCASVEADLRREFRARAECAEAEADSLRATIDNMRAMNIKLTFEETRKVLAAEAECKALREMVRKLIEWLPSDVNPNKFPNLVELITEARAALNPSPAAPE